LNLVVADPREPDSAEYPAGEPAVILSLHRCRGGRDDRCLLLRFQVQQPQPRPADRPLVSPMSFHFHQRRNRSRLLGQRGSSHGQLVQHGGRPHRRLRRFLLRRLLRTVDRRR
jgi:hypothetical protein